MRKNMRRSASYNIFVVFAILVEYAFSCPSVCTCKWKSGKQTVECNDKGLTSLPEGIEVGTQVLMFTGNNVHILPNNLFLSKNVINLQKLYLSRCQIGAISETSFVQLSNLVVLDLGQNILTEIPSNAFKHTPALRELILSGNPIDNVQPNAFVYTPSLVYLDLSNAKIKFVSPSAFPSGNILKTLQLQSNQIVELPNIIVETLSNIHALYVHDNPWVCDCRALPLWRLLVKKLIPHPISPVCNAPMIVSGDAFNELEEDRFACPPKILPDDRLVKGVAGGNATLTCTVEGQPPPDVIWHIQNTPVFNGSTLGLGPQKVFILNVGKRHKVSRLIISGIQVADSGEVRCSAINPAGQTTANFTLSVSMRTYIDHEFSLKHIAGISIGLIILALIMFLIAFMLLTKTKTRSSSNILRNNSPTALANYSSAEFNPIQKPPRLTTATSPNRKDPDIISDMEKSNRMNNLDCNILNSLQISNTVHEGHYSRMESESLSPSSILQLGEIPTHEHYNPGFIDSSRPSLPYDNLATEHILSSNSYNYPSDYGLPIPETKKKSIYEKSYFPGLANANQIGKLYSKNVTFDDVELNPNIYDDSAYSLYTKDDYSTNGKDNISGNNTPTRTISPQQYHVPTSENKVTEKSPSHSWTSTLPKKPVSLGVPVLPPLPNSSILRIKSRGSPDEGFQDGTDV